MLYGSGNRTTHRTLFVIHEQTTVIDQIRHVAMREVTTDDL